MNRKEIYQQIKSLNLQDKVKAVTGENYTRVSNNQLEAIINKAKAAKPKPTKNNKGFFNKLIEILAKKNILLKSEVTEILKD